MHYFVLKKIFFKTFFRTFLVLGAVIVLGALLVLGALGPHWRPLVGRVGRAARVVPWSMIYHFFLRRFQIRTAKIVPGKRFHISSGLVKDPESFTRDFFHQPVLPRSVPGIDFSAFSGNSLRGGD